MMRVCRALACALLVMSSPDGWSYEIATHEEVLTRESVNRSVLLIDNSLLLNLGLRPGINDQAQRYPDSKGEERTIRGLIEIGSNFEDNVSLVPLEARVIFHFYNPINGQGLSRPPFIPAQKASPDWALAPRGSDSRQKFSYWDARQYLLDALTKPTKADRDKSFGLTFQTLGHVMHHLQDMAQPQHVRNDIHCDKLICVPLNAHAPSLFEVWTNRDDVRGALPVNPGAIGYDIASTLFTSAFSNPRRFWHTQSGASSPAAGEGIAEFTNRNFLSAGTNFQSSSGFEMPAVLAGGNSTLTVAELCATAQPSCPPSLTSAHAQEKITFYASLVRDKFLGTDFVNPRASTESIFDERLQAQGAAPVFSLNRFNFEEAYKHLMPRAVAYSAGMINYFFRGKIDYVPDPAQPGKFLIKNLGAEAMEGEFRLYYDTADGTRKPVMDRQGGEVAWQTQGPLVALNGAMSVTQEFDPPADAKTANRYMLVFTGTMGEDRPGQGQVGAVVSKVFGGLATGLVVTPNYVPADSIAGRRLISFNGEDWFLTSESGRVAGNVDWKGAYLNGKPTKVLSWNGPRSRYFVEQGIDPFTPEIFQGGELWSVAPGPVLGAAIAKDAEAKEWLIAVVGVANRDTVYRRPNNKSPSPALYDQVNAPDGWQFIGERARQSFTAFSPWFFNGLGLEGQTVDRFSERIKLQLTLSGPTSAEVTFTPSSILLAAPELPPSTETTVPFGKQFNTHSCSDGTVRFTSGRGHETIGVVSGYTQPLVAFAADYLDGEELLATRLRRSIGTSTSRFYQEELPDSYATVNNCDEGHILDGFHHIRTETSSALELSSEVQISLGATVLTYRSSHTGTTSQVADGPASTSPDGGTPVPGSTEGGTCILSTVEENDFANEYILHMDLRESTLVVYRHELTRKRQGFTGNHCQSIQYSLQFSHKELVDVHRKGGNTTLSLGAFTGTPPGCSSPECQGFVEGTISVPPDHDIGYATDGAGDNALSLRFRRRIIPPFDNVFFNALDQGSLPQLIQAPTPVAGESYYPVGVTR